MPLNFYDTERRKNRYEILTVKFKKHNEQQLK